MPDLNRTFDAIDAAEIKIFAVVVLYRMAPAESPSYRTLLDAYAAANNSGIRLEILLYDNTPGASRYELPDFVHYEASPVNSGLATAYNRAVQLGAARGCTWLLTLDQDSVLPENYLQQMALIAAEQQPRNEVAAIVPHVASGSHTVSPNWYVAHVKPNWFARDYRGIPSKAVYAFNSGALLRITAVQEVGGYNKLFWLDSSDIDLFRRFERAGKQVFIAGHITLQHDFSMTNAQEKMSLFRYQNALAAGSAFFDLEFGTAIGLGHTFLLFHQYLKQVVRGDDIDRQRATLDVIVARLVQSKSKRLSRWRSVQESRISEWELLESFPGNAGVRSATDRVQR